MDTLPNLPAWCGWHFDHLMRDNPLCIGYRRGEVPDCREKKMMKVDESALTRKEKQLKLEEIKTAEPFKSLFPIEGKVLGRVQEDMKRNGYDPCQSVVLWSEKGLVIDGQTRLEAAKNLGLEEVPVHEKSFADENEALAYAIHSQRDRRNLTSADIIRLIDTLDTRLKRGERTDLASPDAKSPEASRRKSAAKTAAAIGVPEPPSNAPAQSWTMPQTK
jgi:hypothetical protein